MANWWWFFMIVHLECGKTQILKNNCCSNISQTNRDVYLLNPLLKMFHSISCSYIQSREKYQQIKKQEKRNPKFHSWGGKRNDNGFSTKYYNEYSSNHHDILATCPLGYLDFYVIINNPISMSDDREVNHFNRNACKRLNDDRQKTLNRVWNILTSVTPIFKELLHKCYLDKKVKNEVNTLANKKKKRHTSFNSWAGKRSTDHFYDQMIVPNEHNLHKPIYSRFSNYVTKRILENRRMNNRWTTLPKANISTNLLISKINICNKVEQNVEFVSTVDNETNKEQSVSKACSIIKQLQEAVICQCLYRTGDHTIKQSIYIINIQPLNSFAKKNMYKSKWDTNINKYGNSLYCGNIKENNGYDCLNTYLPSLSQTFNILDEKRAKSFSSWGGKREAELKNWGVGSKTTVNGQESKRGANVYSRSGKRIPTFNAWSGTRAIDFGYKRWPMKSHYGSLKGKHTPQSDDRNRMSSPIFMYRGKNKIHNLKFEMVLPKLYCIMEIMINYNAMRQKKSKPFNSWGGKRSPILSSEERRICNKIVPMIDFKVRSSLFKELYNNPNLQLTQFGIFEATPRNKLSSLYSISNKSEIDEFRSLNYKVKKLGSPIIQKQVHDPVKIDMLNIEKTTPLFNSCEQKRSPLFSTWYLNKQPNMQLSNGKRRPAFSSWGGKRNDIRKTSIRDIQYEPSNITEFLMNAQEIMCSSKNYKDGWFDNERIKYKEGDYVQKGNACIQDYIDLTSMKKNLALKSVLNRIHDWPVELKKCLLHLWQGFKKQQPLVVHNI